MIRYERPIRIGTKEIQRIFKASLLTQHEFAKLLNVGFNTVRKWLSGETQTPSLLAQEKLVELRDQLIEQGLMDESEK